MRDGDLHGFHYYGCTYSPVAQQRTDIAAYIGTYIAPVTIELQSPSWSWYIPSSLREERVSGPIAVRPVVSIATGVKVWHWSRSKFFSCFAQPGQPLHLPRTHWWPLVGGKEQRCWDRWHGDHTITESATIIQAWFHCGVYHPSGEDQLAPVWTASVLGGQYHWQQHGCGVGLHSICSWGHGWRCHQLSLFFILSFYHYIRNYKFYKCVYTPQKPTAPATCTAMCTHVFKFCAHQYGLHDCI